MMKMLVLSFFVIVFISTCLASYCPNPQDIYPCVCVDRQSVPYTIIICNTNQALNLSSIFSKINKDARALEQVYDIRILNEKLEEIPENVLGNLKVKRIFMSKCSSLKRIHLRAFSAQNMTMSSLEIGCKNVISGPSPYNFYELVNSFKNLEQLEYNSRIETLEPKLTQENGKLLKVRFTNVGKIIGSPFKKFYRIKEIELSHSNLTYLSDGAFTVSNWRTNSHVVDPLIIYLNNNKLNSSSFGKDLFSDISLKNMDVRLILWMNQITYLKEDVFSAFLARNGSKISLFNNPLDCDDCRSAWICHTVTSVKVRQSIGATCSDSERDFTDCSKNFRKCKSKLE